jgi:hypothetical protein
MHFSFNSFTNLGFDEDLMMESPSYGGGGGGGWNKPPPPPPLIPGLTRRGGGGSSGRGSGDCVLMRGLPYTAGEGQIRKV